MEQADETRVEPHVAIKNVAELVRNHALQFIARKSPQATTRDGDGGIGGRFAGGESVDRVLIFEQINFGHGRAGSESHFLDHMAQPALIGVGGLRRDLATAEILCDHATAAIELQAFPAAAESHHRADTHRDQAEKIGPPQPQMRGTPIATITTREKAEAESGGVDRDDDADQRKDEINDQQLRFFSAPAPAG